MHESIIDMILSSIKIIPSKEFAKRSKTYFSLLSIGKIKSGTNSLVTIASPIVE